MIRIILTPLISSVFKALGSHPVIFPCDMSEYPLERKMSSLNKPIVLDFGCVLGSIIRVTIDFNIPIDLSIIEVKRNIIIYLFRLRNIKYILGILLIYNIYI